MGRPKKIIKKPDRLVKKQPIQSVKGMKDILPEEQKYWDFCKEIMEREVKSYGFQKIETPILEKTELFTKAVGGLTDVVEKEMFIFKESGENLSLRPEVTAPITRAYIERGLYNLSQPQKLYCFGPMFRHGKSEAGRERQFHQLDLEIIGGDHPVLDAEIIVLSWSMLCKLGLNNLEVQINSIGCPECQAEYKDMLLDFFVLKQHRLCPICKKRLKKNPLRILSCKEIKCQSLISGVPQIVNHLCENCHNHFKNVLEYLDQAEIPFTLNPSLVRGLDYYTRTIFEIVSTGIKDSAQSALVRGGRYDNLIELLGGKPTPAVNAALGLESIILNIQKQEIELPQSQKPKIFLAQLGELAKKKSLKVFKWLIDAGIPVVEALDKSSIKSQLKLADKLNINLSLILGQKETVEGTILIRDMKSGVQEIIELKKLVSEVKKRLEVLKKEQENKIK